MRVAIAGAGIAGLAAALALARSGHAVTVFEKAAALEEVGAGLQVPPNAMRVLAALGVAGDVSAAAVAPEAIIIRRGHDGGMVQRLPLDRVRGRHGAPLLVIRRAALQAVLAEAVRRQASAAIMPGRPVTGFQDAADGVRLDGIDGCFDALIGADGVRSPVRAAMGIEARLRFRRRRAFRAMVPAQGAPREITLWLAPDAHLVTYPVGGGALNIVAVTRDDDDTPDWSRVASTTAVIARYAGWCGEARDSLASAEAFRSWPLFDRDPDPVWTRGRVVLIGDAAHPMVPFLAQGAAMGIEDAAALARHLAEPVAASLAGFVASRASRVARIQTEARANGERYHWPWPLSTLRDIGLAAIGPDRFLARYDWLWGGGPDVAAR